MFANVFVSTIALYAIIMVYLREKRLLNTVSVDVLKVPELDQFDFRYFKRK